MEKRDFRGKYETKIFIFVSFVVLEKTKQKMKRGNRKWRESLVTKH